MPTQDNLVTFSKGKMNQDNDPRVIQPGEYIRAQNGRIARSEGDGVGSLENTLGNENVAAFVDATAVVLGSVRDISEDRIYYFVKGSEEDAVYEYNEMTGAAFPLLRDNRGYLNFNVDNLITGARVIGTSDPGDDVETVDTNIRSNKLLIWTDNLNPPRKINVNRVRVRYNGQLNMFTESEISLEKAPPLFAPQTSEVFLNIDPATVGVDVLDSFLPDSDLDKSESRKRELVELIIDRLDREENLKEKFPRFAYRFRYEDNEYSAFSPFSPAMFRPDTFNYDQDTGAITGMENQMKAIDVSFNTGGSDVTEIELLYKDTASNVVYVIESYNKADRGWRDNVDLSSLNDIERPIRYSTQKLYRALPSDQLERVYDDVPIRAKTLEIADNRVMFGNYVDRYDLIDVRKIYNAGGQLTETLEEEIVVDFDARVSRPEEVGQEGDGIQPGVGERSLKSDRDYELGIVYLDNLGRQTPVLTSSNNSVRIPIDRANKINKLSVEINSKAPEFATHYRFFVKDTRAAVHHNVIPLETQVQPDDDAFRWFRLADTDQGKIQEGDYLNLKVHNGMFSYPEDSREKIQVRVEEVGIKGRNFLEVNPPRTGRIEDVDDEGNITNIVDEGVEYTIQRPGLWMKIKNLPQIPKDVEQPATAGKSFSRSNNARNANFRPIKNIPGTPEIWKDMTYYYRGGNVTSDDDFDESSITFSGDYVSGGAIPTGALSSAMTGPVAGYGPMRVEVEIVEGMQFRVSWWLSPSVEAPAVVTSSYIHETSIPENTAFVEGTTPATALACVNGISVGFNLNAADYKVGDRWVATWRTSDNFMWRCWDPNGSRPGGPNDASRRAFNARRSHIMLYGPGMLEQGINGNSMIQFGVQDGLNRNLSGNPIALPFSRNKYFTEDVFYATLEEWMFEEGYWTSSGQERLHGTARDGENIGIHQFGFYRGLPITPDNDADLAAITASLAGGGVAGIAAGAALTAPSFLLGLAALNPLFLLGGAIVGGLIAAFAGGKTTEDFWRLSSGPASQLINEEEGVSFPLYAFVQSGTYNASSNNKKAEPRQNGMFSFFQGNGAMEDQINMMNIAFETIPQESELDVYYEIGDTFTCLNGVHFGNDMHNTQRITYLDPNGMETQASFSTAANGEIINHTETAKTSTITVNLDHFNCFAWNNGVEVKSIRDEIGTVALDEGAKASTVVENYQEASNFASIIFSAPFNEQSGVNGLNEFSSTKAALRTIIKDMDELDGSIQHIYSTDTNLVVFQEDKVNRVLVNKDQLLNADGTSNITSSQQVLGQTVAYTGEYGISTNPESFAVYGNRLYFADSNRGVICRLGQSGIEEISNFGMRDFFREELRHNYGTPENPEMPIVIGTYDDYHDQYIVSVREPHIDPSFPRANIPLRLSKQAFLSRTDACRYPEDDLQYTQVYEFYTLNEPLGFQIGDIIYYDEARTKVFKGDNDWFVWFDSEADIDFTVGSDPVTNDNVTTQTFNGTFANTPLPGQEVTVGTREGATREFMGGIVTNVQGDSVTIRYTGDIPTPALTIGQEVEISLDLKFVINIDNFGIVRDKQDCRGILPPSHDAMRVSIAGYTSPEEACAKGLVARLIYHDGDDPSADIEDSIYDTPYGTDEFFEGNYFKGRTQRRGWYQMFDGADLEDYVINIVQGKVADKIRCEEISAGRRRVLTTQNPVQRRANEEENRLATRVCSSLPTEVSFHDGENEIPEIGDQIFRDGFTNSPLANGYYALEGGFYIRVTDGGLISEKRLCSITICVDDVVRGQLIDFQNQTINSWTWRGIGGDTRDLPTVTASTPVLGDGDSTAGEEEDAGSITLNGAITSFGEFNELDYQWYILRDPGTAPDERGLIDQGSIVVGGQATTVGAVSRVTVSDLAAFTTYYTMFVVTIGATRVTSEVLPVTLSRSNQPTLTLAIDNTTANIGEDITLTTSGIVDTTDTWTQTWFKVVDGVTTEITPSSDAAANGPFTGQDGDVDPGGTLEYQVIDEGNGVRVVDFYTVGTFTGATIQSNTVRLTRNTDEDRFGAFSDALDEDGNVETVTTSALVADPTLDDNLEDLVVDGVPTEVFNIVSNYGDNVPTGDFPQMDVLTTDTYNQTATYTLPVYTDQVETRQSRECIAADGCPTLGIEMGGLDFRLVVTTTAAVNPGAEQDATREVSGIANANVFAAAVEVADSREGGVVGTYVLQGCTDFAPAADTCFVGSNTGPQTRTCTWEAPISAITADFYYECVSPDALDGSPGCTTGPNGEVVDANGDYVIDNVEVSEATTTETMDPAVAGDTTTPVENPLGESCTKPEPVDGTAAFGSITAVGSITGGTVSSYTLVGTPTISTETAGNTVRQVTQTTTYPSVTENRVNGVQNGRRTCNQVMAPQNDGNPGTCTGNGGVVYQIGQQETIPSHFTGLFYLVPGVASSFANGGIDDEEVNNPEYIIGTLSPSSLSWSDSQGIGTDMSFTYSVSADAGIASLPLRFTGPSFLTLLNGIGNPLTGAGGPVPSPVNAIARRNVDTAHTGTITMFGTAPSGTEYQLATISASAAEVDTEETVTQSGAFAPCSNFLGELGCNGPTFTSTSGFVGLDEAGSFGFTSPWEATGIFCLVPGSSIVAYDDTSTRSAQSNSITVTC